MIFISSFYQNSGSFFQQKPPRVTVPCHVFFVRVVPAEYGGDQFLYPGGIQGLYLFQQHKIFEADPVGFQAGAGEDFMEAGEHNGRIARGKSGPLS